MHHSSPLRIEVAPGELIDKLTILEIKSARMHDPQKLRNVRRELDILNRTRAEHLSETPELRALSELLKSVNESLWDIEDRIRDCERNGDFGARFIELARSVYRVNDERARLKREINELLNSTIVEEKSYADYAPALGDPAAESG